MFSDDMCQIDAGMADQQFHTNPPILQANETCEIGKNHGFKNYDWIYLEQLYSLKKNPASTYLSVGVLIYPD